MHSFFLRIFISFWAIIVITIVSAATLGYVYSERARVAVQTFEISDPMLAAGEALQLGGREGLTEWLRSLPGVTNSLVYVIDERGNDLLGRRVPPPIMVALKRFKQPHSRRFVTREGSNLRPARPFTELIGPDGDEYTLFVMPPQGAVGRWLSHRGGMTLVLLALIVSATVSLVLARAISRPIRRFRESANAIAEGKLDTRVREYVGQRRDEIGLLARDFDRMTEELKLAWQRQTELTRNVSHELRSPLARLRVALELARRRTGDLPELDKIETETERVDALIGQILEYSRLDAAPQDDYATIDLDELLRSIVADVAFEFGEAGADTRIDYASEHSASTAGYASALRSAIENVLRNAARHHTGSDPVTVRLDTEGSDAVITIEDHGGGIAEHELPRIFEPFYRAAVRSSASAPQGSGLGLSIAGRAIELNKGTLEARNTEQGLAVEIRLAQVTASDSSTVS